MRVNVHMPIDIPLLNHESPGKEIVLIVRGFAEGRVPEIEADYVPAVWRKKFHENKLFNTNKMTLDS